MRETVEFARELLDGARVPTLINVVVAALPKADRGGGVYGGPHLTVCHSAPRQRNGSQLVCPAERSSERLLLPL